MKKDCVYEDKCYSDGAAVRISGESMICNDGRWEKELNVPSGVTISPGKDMSDL